MRPVDGRERDSSDNSAKGRLALEQYNRMLAGEFSNRTLPVAGWQRLFAAFFWSIALGALFAAPLGRQRQISVELWLAAISIWLARSVILDLLKAVPLRLQEIKSLVRLRRVKPEPPRDRPRALVSIEGLLLNARDNDRAFALRLRPRLDELVSHHLRVNHGIDVDDPNARAAVLGDVGWIVERGTVERAPTLDELDVLLDRIQPPAWLATAGRAAGATVPGGGDG